MSDTSSILTKDKRYQVLGHLDNLSKLQYHQKFDSTNNTLDIYLSDMQMMHMSRNDNAIQCLGNHIAKKYYVDTNGSFFNLGDQCQYNVSHIVNMSGVLSSNSTNITNISNTVSNQIVNISNLSYSTQTQITNLSGSVASLSTTSNTRIVNLSGSVDSLSNTTNTRIVNLSSTVGANVVSISNLSGSVDSLSTTTNTKIVNLSSTVGANVVSISNLSGSIDSLSNTTNTRIVNLSSTVGANVVSISNLSGSLDSLSTTTNTAITNLSGIVGSNVIKVTNLSSSIDTNISQIANISNTLQSNYAPSGSYVTTTNLNTSLASYSKITDVSSSLSAYNTSLVSFTNTSLALYSKITDVSSSLASFNTSLVSFTNTSLAPFARTANVNTSLSAYATTANVNTSLALKQNTLNSTVNISTGTLTCGNFTVQTGRNFNVGQGTFWHAWTFDSGDTGQSRLYFAPSNLSAPLTLFVGGMNASTVSADIVNVNNTLKGPASFDIYSGNTIVCRLTSSGLEVANSLTVDTNTTVNGTLQCGGDLTSSGGTTFVNCIANLGANGALQVKSTNVGSRIDGASFFPYANNNNIINFLDGGGSGIRGKIVGNGNNGVFYNTSSDRRLKTNITPMLSMLEIINKLRPVEYDWVADGVHGFGMIAQEAFQVLPHLRQDFQGYCLKTKECKCSVCHDGDVENPVDSHGKPHYHSLDYGLFTPYLIKAVQELTARIVDLEKKIKSTK